jgi:hypothetical protein
MLWATATGAVIVQAAAVVPLIVTAADTDKTAKRVTGMERGGVSEKTEAGVEKMFVEIAIL